MWEQQEQKSERDVFKQADRETLGSVKGPGSCYMILILAVTSLDSTATQTVCVMLANLHMFFEK